MSKLRSAYVEKALDVTFETNDDYPLDLQDLVGLAIRRNPKRAHLLVSEVLGKHIPQNPQVIAFAGRLLGSMVANVLNGSSPTQGLSPAFEALKSYLDGGSWYNHNEDLLQAVPSNTRTVATIGYAETATSLGFLVADTLNSWYVHSTRSFDTTTTPYGNFEESHSHATSHQLIPTDPALLNSGAPLVLIDDEFSTGSTIINTITELHAVSEHKEYIVGALIDCRNDADRLRMDTFADSLGVKITVVALASGIVKVPSNAVERAAAIANIVDSTTNYEPDIQEEAVLNVIDIDSGEIQHTRFGVMPNEYLVNQARNIASTIGSVAGKTLVLGTEEFLSFPLLVACELDMIPENTGRIFSSSTTQSPVIAINNEHYAISSVMKFDAEQSDGSLGRRFAYNIHDFNHIILILEQGENIDSHMGYNKLIHSLRQTTQFLTIITL